MFILFFNQLGGSSRGQLCVCQLPWSHSPFDHLFVYIWPGATKMESSQLQATLESDVSVLVDSVLLLGTRVIAAALVNCHIGRPRWRWAARTMHYGFHFGLVFRPWISNDDLIGRNAHSFLLLPFHIRKRFFFAPLMNAIKHLKYLPKRIGVY